MHGWNFGALKNGLAASEASMPLVCDQRSTSPIFDVMDLVVSDDAHSLLTENALKAYQLVNTVKRLHLPTFIRYSGFKELVKRSA